MRTNELLLVRCYLTWLGADFSGLGSTSSKVIRIYDEFLFLKAVPVRLLTTLYGRLLKFQLSPERVLLGEAILLYLVALGTLANLVELDVATRVFLALGTISLLT